MVLQVIHQPMRAVPHVLLLLHALNIACMHAAKVAGTWLKSVRALVLQLVTPLHAEAHTVEQPKWTSM